MLVVVGLRQLHPNVLVVGVIYSKSFVGGGLLVLALSVYSVVLSFVLWGFSSIFV